MDVYNNIIEELNTKLSVNIDFNDWRSNWTGGNASTKGEQMYVFFLYAHFLDDSLLLQAITTYEHYIEDSKDFEQFIESWFGKINQIFDSFQKKIYGIPSSSSLNEIEKAKIEKHKQEQKKKKRNIIFFLPSFLSLTLDNPLPYFKMNFEIENENEKYERKRLKREAAAAAEELRMAAEAERLKRETVAVEDTPEIKGRPISFYNEMSRLGANLNELVNDMEIEGKPNNVILQWIDEQTKLGKTPEIGWIYKSKFDGSMKAYIRSRNHTKKSKQKKQRSMDGSRRKVQKSKKKKNKTSPKKKK